MIQVELSFLQSVMQQSKRNRISNEKICAINVCSIDPKVEIESVINGKSQYLWVAPNAITMNRKKKPI